ncbi:MAG: GAF domain-containing protein [Spirochaetales bacterium]|nr:GAF domain-containing protein [Spirochaetales bacterium]
MNSREILNQEKIHKLQGLIEEKKKENELLKFHYVNLQQRTVRYRKIFDKSYLSIWEEDLSEVYQILDSLPCNSGKELQTYLLVHPDITAKLIRRMKVIQINDYTFKMFGSSSKKELLSSLKRVVRPESYPGIIGIFRAMKDKLPNCRHETTAFTISGRKLDILFTAYLPGRGNGNILISLVDITKRKQDEDALKYTIEQAEEQKRIIKVLQNILLTLTSSLDKEKILVAILREARKIIPYSSANIRLLENESLIVAATEGYNDYGAEEFMSNSVVTKDKLGDAARFINNGKINIIPDTRNYSDWTIFPETSYILGYIGVPIKWNDRIIGLLSLDSDKTDSFTQSDSDKLKPFAHAASTALQSSYLFELATDEIKKRTEVEAATKKSLEEKEILLREIHHRVKNNLSLIISLINLQSGMISDSIDPHIFEDLKQRVYTISLVHERLYSSNNLSSVDLKTYLVNLTESIRTSPIFNQRIEFRIDIEGAVEIEADTLVPLALLLNELIINSVKYAFPNKPGIISINVSDEMGNHKIIFQDNGIGLPENWNNSSSHMGLFLVKTLTEQIGGSISFVNDSGAVSTIIFPKK